jgi:alkylhydroperoxidase family enzyme
VAPSSRTAEQRELLARVDVAGPMGEANIFTTLVRAPDVFRQWLRFGGSLLRGTLPARDRELLILRTAVNCTGPYEWGQHVRIGVAVGLSDDEIARIPSGPTAQGWDASDRALLAAADELHETCALSDARYAELAARYDETQLIELAMVVGHYQLLAMTLNMLGVPLDDGLVGLPA